MQAANFFSEDEAGFEFFQAIEGQKGERGHHKDPQQQTLKDGPARNGQCYMRGEEVLEKRGEEPLEQKTQGEPQQGAQQAQDGHHPKKVLGNEAAGGPDRFDDGHGIILFTQEGGQRALDADPGQQ